MAKAGRGSEQIMIRVPDGMRDALKAVADENNRSMNAEIVARLEQSFEHQVEAEASSALTDAKTALDTEKAVNTALRANFEILAQQLAGPIGENREEVLGVLTALRILGRQVPE
nr:Arc family DNA-binding protein [Brucella anthropi]